MVPEVMLTFCNRFQVVILPADLAQFFGRGHFGRLAGVPHHLTCLALVVYYSWDYAGHIATSFEWLQTLHTYGLKSSFVRATYIRL